MRHEVVIDSFSIAVFYTLWSSNSFYDYVTTAVRVVSNIFTETSSGRIRFVYQYNIVHLRIQLSIVHSKTLSFLNVSRIQNLVRIRISQIIG